MTVVGCNGGSSGSDDAGPPPVDQCLGSTDLALIASIAALVDGGIPDGGVPDGGPYPLSYNTQLGHLIADTCAGPGQPCFANVLIEDDVEACVMECLMGTAGDGLSIGCVSCYFEIVSCGTENCITQCAVDPDSPLCSECFLAECGPRVEECTGLPLVP